MKKGLYRLEVYYKQNATESEKEVLRYLIHHTREAVEMDIHTIAKKCFCSPAAIIRLCKKNGFSGFKELKQALLLSGRYIYLYGISASFLVAKDFQQKFERVGKRTFLYEDIHLQLVSSTNLEPGDIAVIVSYSGLTKEIIEIARNFKLYGEKYCLRTSY